MGYLYSFTGPSGKKYIGITNSLKINRYKDHLRCAKLYIDKRHDRPLYRSMRKHGFENFKFSILVISNDWNYLCLLERLSIRAFDTIFPKGYNLTSGGEGINDRPDISKQKASKSLKEAWARDDGTRREDRRGVDAMRIALINDSNLEKNRRTKISVTMKERKIGIGSSNGYAKLTDEDIEAIRNELRGGNRDGDIAGRFHVSRKLISFIRHGKRWNDGSVYPKLPRTDLDIRKKVSERTRIAMQRPEVKDRIKARWSFLHSNSTETVDILSLIDIEQ